jgi:hypothetical protein
MNEPIAENKGLYISYYIHTYSTKLNVHNHCNPIRYFDLQPLLDNHYNVGTRYYVKNPVLE